MSTYLNKFILTKMPEGFIEKDLTLLGFINEIELANIIKSFAIRRSLILRPIPNTTLFQLGNTSPINKERLLFKKNNKLIVTAPLLKIDTNDVLNVTYLSVDNVKYKLNYA